KQFEKWWPELQEKLTGIPPVEDRPERTRSDRQILEELLGLTRGLVRRAEAEDFHAGVEIALEKVKHELETNMKEFRYINELQEQERKYPATPITEDRFREISRTVAQWASEQDDSTTIFARAAEHFLVELRSATDHPDPTTAVPIKPGALPEATHWLVITIR